MNEDQEHAVTNANEDTGLEVRFDTCEDPGDCDKRVFAEVPDAPPEELEPVMVPVRR